MKIRKTGLLDFGIHFFLGPQKRGNSFKTILTVGFEADTTGEIIAIKIR